VGDGSLGQSLYSSETVRSIIADQIAPTIELTVLALLASSTLGILIGVVSSVRRNSKMDYSLRLFVNTFLGVPNFVLATSVLLLPAYFWGWSPPLRYVPLTEDPIDNLLFFAIPVMVLAIGLAASVARLTRTSTLEVIKTDYVRTAHAKGLAERTVLYGHVLKNSLMPVLTIIGIQITFLLSGVIIIEQVFSIPGLGTLMLSSINQRNWPVVQGLTLISGVIVIGVNITVEILYGYFDPRLRAR
jgi:peptide/nickel transport system permease protein